MLCIYVKSWQQKLFVNKMFMIFLVSWQKFKTLISFSPRLYTKIFKNLFFFSVDLKLKYATRRVHFYTLHLNNKNFVFMIQFHDRVYTFLVEEKFCVQSHMFSGHKMSLVLEHVRFVSKYFNILFFFFYLI